MEYKLKCIEKYLYLEEINIFLKKEDYLENIKKYMSDYEFFNYLAESNELELIDIDKKKRFPKIKIIWDKYVFISNLNNLLKISKKNLDLKDLYLNANEMEKKLLILYIDCQRNTFIQDFLNILIKKNKKITNEEVISYITEQLPRRNPPRKILKSINNYSSQRKNDLASYLISYFCNIGILKEKNPNEFTILKNKLSKIDLNSKTYDFLNWIDPYFLKKFN